jgi:hypothetical protein
MTPTGLDPERPDDGLRPSARALRYGVAVAIVIVGILCGAIIPGTTGGTICTAVVGIGLVGVVSLVFYDVGLTEDRDRARLREKLDGEPRDGRDNERGNRGSSPPRRHDGVRLPVRKPGSSGTSRLRDEHRRLR